MWKDPRVCLLLPYWRRLLAGPIAARAGVAGTDGRGPLAPQAGPDVADRGLAIWTRYNRAALEGLVGIDTFVVDYESIIEDPKAFVDTVVGWLGSLSQFEHRTDGWDRDGAVASIDAGLRHQESADSEKTAGLVIDEQRQLVDQLAATSGAIARSDPSSPASNPPGQPIC